MSLASLYLYYARLARKLRREAAFPHDHAAARVIVTGHRAAASLAAQYRALAGGP